MSNQQPLKLRVTKHFSHEPDDVIGELTLYEGETIPANCVFTITGKVKRHRTKPDEFIPVEITMITDEHYKEFLDNLPDSCVKAGGHIKGKYRKCQLCGMTIPRKGK